MNKYKILTKDWQYPIIEADGFDINKDEGIVTFYIGSAKAYFNLNDITRVYIIKKEENEE